MVERGMSLSTRTLSFHWNGVMKSTYVVFLIYHIKSASLYLLQSTNMVLIFWEPNWWIYRLLCTWFRKGEIMCGQWSPFSLGSSTVFFFVSLTLKHDALITYMIKKKSVHKNSDRGMAEFFAWTINATTNHHISN